jgi:hypothetical protein
MARFVNIPTELIFQISSRIESKDSHSFSLTNQNLYHRNGGRLFGCPSIKALAPLLEDENVAVFRRFLQYNLDAKVLPDVKSGNPSLDLFTSVGARVHMPQLQVECE